MSTAELIDESATSTDGAPTGARPPRRGRVGRTVRTTAAFLRSLPTRAVRGSRALAAAALEQPRRALTVMVVAILVLAAAAGGFAFLAHQRSTLDAAAQDARAAAQQNMVTLLSYDYRTVGGDVAQRQELTTGQFRDEYAALIKNVVTPAATSQQIVTQTQVANAAPTESVSAERVSVLLFLNQTTTTAGKADPTFSGSRVRVGMNNVDGRWLIADVTPI